MKETATFAVGDRVRWKRFSTKVYYGVVVAVVPPGVEPYPLVPLTMRANSKGWERKRPEVSYLVMQNNTNRVYWPSVFRIEKLGEIDGNR